MPLHLACGSGRLDVVRYLLTPHNANTEAADNDGHTPLNFACKHGHLEVARLLLDAGADLFATSDDGKTVFDTARTDLVNFLLQTYAAKMSARNGNQAIHAILRSATYSYICMDGRTFRPPLALFLRVSLPNTSAWMAGPFALRWLFFFG